MSVMYRFNTQTFNQKQVNHHDIVPFMRASISSEVANTEKAMKPYNLGPADFIVSRQVSRSLEPLLTNEAQLVTEL